MAGASGIHACVGYVSYRPGANPYQQLFAEAVECAGYRVCRLEPRKWFPLRAAASAPVDMLQLDWPHDWYQGRNALARAAKFLMFQDGLRLLRNRAVVWTAHNLAAHDASDPEHERRMIQSLIDVCDGIIVLSEVAVTELHASYRLAPGTLVQVVPHGHYIEHYPNEISRKEARRQFHVPPSGRVVVSLGRLQPYKGLEQLIGAFGRVARSGDTLILAGAAAPAGYADSLRRLSSLTGRADVDVRVHDRLVPADELQVYFNACDVVALPFRKVLNSGSLLLAMGFGCPVVAPRLGSIPEVACPEGWFGYEAADDQGLDAALQSALQAAGDTALREHVRRFTADRYSWSIVRDQVGRLYQRVLQNHARRDRPRQ